MKKKYLSLVLSLILLLMNLFGCSGGNKTTASDDSNENKIIKIGVYEPLTGNDGGGGYQEVLGIKYANEIYKTIEINGETYTIELDIQDNESDKTKGVRAANKLVADKCVGILGSYGSGVSIAAGQIFKSAGIPAIGCSCTNPLVTSGNDYYFRTCFLDPFQGTVMANYVKKHGYSKVAILTALGEDYSSGLGSFFKTACENLGIEVVAEVVFQKDAQDFHAQLTNIKNANPDFVFAPSSIVAAPLILEQGKGDLGITAQFGGGDTWENGTIIDNAHGHAEGIVLTTFYDENSDATDEGNIFLRGNGKLTGFSDYLVSNKQPEIIPAVSALGYDAYIAMYKAIEKAQSLKGEDIKNALNELSFTGVTGDIKFNQDGDAIKNSAYIKEVEKGRFVFKEISSIE